MISEDRITEVVESVKNDIKGHNEVDAFLEAANDSLIGVYGSMGRWIRNEYRLWEYKWTPEMKQGFDASPYHPDAVSYKILKRVYDELGKENGI